jgi:hypothetical protein
MQKKGIEEGAVGGGAVVAMGAGAVAGAGLWKLVRRFKSNYEGHTNKMNPYAVSKATASTLKTEGGEKKESLYKKDYYSGFSVLNKNKMILAALSPDKKRTEVPHIDLDSAMTLVRLGDFQCNKALIGKFIAISEHFQDDKEKYDFVSGLAKHSSPKVLKNLMNALSKDERCYGGIAQKLSKEIIEEPNPNLGRIEAVALMAAKNGDETLLFKTIAKIREMDPNYNLMDLADHKGRGLIHYAAKSSHPEIFATVRSIMNPELRKKQVEATKERASANTSIPAAKTEKDWKRIHRRADLLSASDILDVPENRPGFKFWKRRNTHEMSLKQAVAIDLAAGFKPFAEKGFTQEVAKRIRKEKIAHTQAEFVGLVFKFAVSAASGPIIPKTLAVIQGLKHVAPIAKFAIGGCVEAFGGVGSVAAAFASGYYTRLHGPGLLKRAWNNVKGSVGSNVTLKDYLQKQAEFEELKRKQTSDKKLSSREQSRLDGFQEIKTMLDEMKKKEEQTKSLSNNAILDILKKGAPRTLDELAEVTKKTFDAQIKAAAKPEDKEELRKMSNSYLAKINEMKKVQQSQGIQESEMILNIVKGIACVSSPDKVTAIVGAKDFSDLKESMSIARRDFSDRKTSMPTAVPKTKELVQILTGSGEVEGNSAPTPPHVPERKARITGRGMGG